MKRQRSEHCSVCSSRRVQLGSKQLRTPWTSKLTELCHHICHRKKMRRVFFHFAVSCWDVNEDKNKFNSLLRAVFNWMSKHHNRSNPSDQSWSELRISLSQASRNLTLKRGNGLKRFKREWSRNDCFKIETIFKTIVFFSDWLRDGASFLDQSQSKVKLKHVGLLLTVNWKLLYLFLFCLPQCCHGNKGPPKPVPRSTPKWARKLFWVVLCVLRIENTSQLQRASKK